MQNFVANDIRRACQTYLFGTAQKRKFSIKDFVSKCD